MTRVLAPDLLFDGTRLHQDMTVTVQGGMITAVTRDGQLIGVISDGDLRRNMETLMDRTASQVANPDPITVTADTLAVQALALMNARKINALLVAEDGRATGVLHLHDLLRASVA